MEKEIQTRLYDDRGDRIPAPFQSMTLRDYFAAKAMQSFILMTKDFSDSQMIATKKTLPEAAYGVADAMLKAREGK